MKIPKGPVIVSMSDPKEREKQLRCHAKEGVRNVKFYVRSLRERLGLLGQPDGDVMGVHRNLDAIEAYFTLVDQQLDDCFSDEQGDKS